MTTERLRELLTYAETSPIADDAPILRTLPTGGAFDDLLELLRERNGIFAFDRALHVFPTVGSQTTVLTLELWNEAHTWKCGYPDTVDDCYFFAEDLFGTQFFITKDTICSFDPETGERSEMAKSLDDWIALVVGEPDVALGSTIAKEWTARHGLLPEGQRLVPIKPFVLGGDFTVENLRALNAVKSMRYRADLCRQLRELPDGADVELRVNWPA